MNNDSKELVKQRILKQLAVSRIWSTYAGPVLVVIALLLGGWAYYTKGAATGAAMYYVVAVLCLFMGIGFMAMAIPAKKYRRLLAYADNTPDKIVWMYQLVITRNGVPSEVMVLGDETGQLFRFPLQRRRGQQDVLMDAFAGLFNQAVIGYSPERSKLFKRQPQQFRQLAGDVG
jgi:hypothetical protein